MSNQGTGARLVTDYSRQFAFIDGCDNPESLRNLIERAKAEGAPVVAEAAFKKLVGLVPAEQPGTVEYDFWVTVNAFEEVLKQERGRTTRLSRTRQKVGRVGVVQTLEDWAEGGKTEGFDMLIERDMPELTGEAIVLRHPEHFSAKALAAARKRLIDADVNLNGLLGS